MGKEFMPGMPILKTKRVFTVEDPEGLLKQAGFTKDAKDVEMMNQMMVEGSGMEGMDMGSSPGRGAGKNQGPADIR